MFEEWFYMQIDACHDGWDFGLRCNDITYNFMEYFYHHWTGNEIAIQNGSRLTSHHVYMEECTKRS